MFCWLAVVAPLQYVITLVTGALVRGALASRRIGFAGRPVTVTSSPTAGALFVVSLLT